jgi:hypothetical protein
LQREHTRHVGSNVFWFQHAKDISRTSLSRDELKRRGADPERLGYSVAGKVGELQSKKAVMIGNHAPDAKSGNHPIRDPEKRVPPERQQVNFNLVLATTQEF